MWDLRCLSSTDALLMKNGPLSTAVTEQHLYVASGWKNDERKYFYCPKTQALTIR